MINEVDTFLNTNDFAEAFTVTPPAGTAIIINGVWTSENTPSQTGNVTIINDSPQVEFSTADSLTIVRKSTVKRNSTNETFYVTDPGVDVSGFTIKTLSRVTPQ